MGESWGDNIMRVRVLLTDLVVYSKDLTASQLYNLMIFNMINKDRVDSLIPRTYSNI